MLQQTAGYTNTVKGSCLISTFLKFSIVENC